PTKYFQTTYPQTLKTSTPPKTNFSPPNSFFNLFKITNQTPIFTHTQPKPQSSYPYTTSQYPNIIKQQITLKLKILPHPKSKKTKLTFSFKRIESYNIKESKISTFHP
ncbi:hypothetical protein DF186_14000, partial [Enterococcus hirae]